MNSLQNRLQRVFLLYKYFLENQKYDLVVSYLNEFPFTIEQEKKIYEIISRISFLEKKIIPFLPKNWKWERINFLEKAILVNALAEMILFSNKKAIVINESVKIAKTYCDSTSYSFINALLDNF